MISPPDAMLASLTFDDGPDPEWTPRILDALLRVDAKATFFVITSRASESPHLIDRMVSEGHEVALHCTRHVRHTEMSESEIFSDTRLGIETLAPLGVKPKNWRPPWGIYSEGTQRIADEFRLRLIHWTADTHDWRGDSSKSMLREIEGGLGDGSVVLMHDGLGPGATRKGCEGTLALVSPLVESLSRLGMRTVTISELLSEKAAVGG